MKFFIDTANLEQIKEAYDLGVLDGVTTNPSLMAKEGIKGIKTHSKRYTYVLGPNESCKTAAERFSMLAEQKNTTQMARGRRLLRALAQLHL